MQVQVRVTQSGRGGDRQLSSFQQAFGSIEVGEGSLDVASHRGDVRPARGQGIEVLGRPVPDLHREAEVVNAADPLFEWQGGEAHLRAYGESQRLRLIEHAHRGTSFFTGTGAPGLTVSIEASARRSARRPSWPVSVGRRRSRTASVNSTNSAV